MRYREAWVPLKEARQNVRSLRRRWFSYKDNPSPNPLYLPSNHSSFTRIFNHNYPMHLKFNLIYLFFFLLYTVFSYSTFSFYSLCHIFIRLTLTPNFRSSNTNLFSPIALIYGYNFKYLESDTILNVLDVFKFLLWLLILIIF